MWKIARASNFSLQLALASLNASHAQDTYELKVGDTSYTVEQLEADFLQRTIKTVSTWTGDEVVAYSGPSLLDVADAAGISDVSAIRLTAADDYAITIPIDIIKKFHPIIATRVEGESIRFEDKGPDRVIWPRSDYSDQLGEEWDVYWLWYLQSIEAQ